MTLIDLQRRLAEIGRIRIGHKTDRGHPGKLDTFRLTSPDQQAIINAAQLYGGTPSPWQAPAGNQWEVITDTTVIDVIVPPADLAFSQHYEQWTAAGCQVRCDGQTDSIGDRHCHCDPDARDCTIHTRLSVMIRDLPGLGVWRLDTQGYYAAVELAGAVHVINQAAAAGQMLPARLRLDQRTSKKQGQTRRYAVPVLDVAVTPGQLVGGAATAPPVLDEPADTPALEAPKLTPVPDDLPERPVGTIRDQLEAAQKATQAVRRRSPDVPATGLQPRTAEAADSHDTSPPVEPVTAPDDLVRFVQQDAPNANQTMADIEAALRDLYRRMEQAGLWPATASGQDALHAALAKHYGVDHVGDLRKANLLAFTQRSWQAARQKVNG